MWCVAVSGWGKNETMRDLEQNLWEPKRDLEALYSTLLFPTLLFSTLLLWNVRNTEVSLVNFPSNNKEFACKQDSIIQDTSLFAE